MKKLLLLSALSIMALTFFKNSSTIKNSNELDLKSLTEINTANAESPGWIYCLEYLYSGMNTVYFCGNCEKYNFSNGFSYNSCI